MMQLNQVNWDKRWEEEMKKASGVASWSDTGAKRGLNRWEEKINRPQREEDPDYASQFLQKIKLNPQDKVLDIGCGAGNLTLPIARQVKKVTSLDISQKMLNLVKEKASKESLSNIDYIHKDWEKLTLGKDIDKHDVVIASRCLGMFDLKKELIKLNNASRGNIYLSRTAEEKDFFSAEVYKLAGKKYYPLPDYFYIYNLLYQLGISAKIDFIKTNIRECYFSIGQAIKVWQWKMNELNPALEEKLRIYFSKSLIKIGDDKWSAPPFECSWALISWKAQKDLQVEEQIEKHRTNFGFIDWNQLWEKAFKASPWMKREVKPEKWNNFALRFNEGVHKDWDNRNSFINQILRKIEQKIEPDFTVLDIGCGPGTFAIPLGQKVKKVTAVDISSSMLKLAQKNATSKNIYNIDYICKDWEKLTLGKDIDKHDVIIASRCLGGLNLKDKLLSLNQMANKAVYLTWIIKVSELQKKAYQIVNRKYSQEPDYIYLYNLLYQLGIYAQVDFIECDGYRKDNQDEEGRESFVNLERAMEHYKWILGELSLEEENKIKNYLTNTYEKTKEGKLISPNYLKSIWSWALLYWWKV